MRILFIGSGELACPALERLLGSDRDEVVGVVCQPDRPKGRNRKVGACPVKSRAVEQGLPVLTPEKIGDAESMDAFRRLDPELIVVAAYGQYIPSRALNLAPRGSINLHPSLLPKYRGAAPIQGAIANGETVTGVTILYVGKDMDAGDIIRQLEIPIGEDDTTATLEPRLAEAGAALLLQAIDDIRSGAVRRVPQDHGQATYVHKLTKEDGRVDWTLPARTLANRIRAYQPWPGSVCEFPRGSGHMVKLLRARVEPGSGLAGEVLSTEGEGPLVAAGQEALRLLEVLPEGRKPMSGRGYLNGHHLSVGDRLG